MEKGAKGYSYYVDQDQIEWYRKWPAERKLRWLFFGAKLRKNLPADILARQEEFRTPTSTPTNSKHQITNAK